MKLVHGILACGIAIMSSSFAFGQVAATLNGDIRITGDLTALPGGGNAGDESGGFTSLVVGLSNTSVQNWALMGFDTTPATGETVSGATLTIGVQTGFNGGVNHGTADDTFSIHELFTSNAGWEDMGGAIQNSVTNIHTGGGPTFQNQSATGNPITTVQWRDVSGTFVDNFIGAYDPSAAVGDSVSGWISGEAPPSITFNFDAATAQAWVDAGFIDLVLQVNDDGSNTSRFNLTNSSPNLEFSQETTTILGDIDMNGVVNFLDITPFIAVLSAGGFQIEADINEDGVVNFLDITPFIAILSST